VKHSLRILLMLALATAVGVPAFASAYTLTFDDLPYPGLGAAIPNGYGNLNWSNEFYLDGTLYPGTGYQYGIVSGTNVAYNGFASTAVMFTNPGVVLSLDSGWFTSAFFTQNVEIDTYLAGNLTGAFVFPALFSQPTFIDFGNVPFDTAYIFTPSGSQLVMDNLTLNTVPEPASMLLLGTGALAVVNRLRKRIS